MARRKQTGGDSTSESLTRIRPHTTPKTRDAVKAAGSPPQKTDICPVTSLSPAKKLAKLVRNLSNNAIEEKSDVPQKKKTEKSKEKPPRRVNQTFRVNKSTLDRHASNASKSDGPRKVPDNDLSDRTKNSKSRQDKAEKVAMNDAVRKGPKNTQRTRQIKKEGAKETSSKVRPGSNTGQKRQNGAFSPSIVSSSKQNGAASVAEKKDKKSKLLHKSDKKDRKKKPKAEGKPPPAGDIAALLRLGEGAQDEMSASDDSDWEAVDTQGSELATKGYVEVTLPSDLAHQLKKKRKKKEFDVDGYVRRQVQAARRTAQNLLHRVHLLCLVSRTLQLNTLLNSETLLARAMSMLPSTYAYPPKRVTVRYVEQFLKWFKSKVEMVRPDGGAAPSEDVFSTLETRLRCRSARTGLELVCLFVLILRAIAVNCRLVMSLQPTPLKPPAETAATAGTAQKQARGSSNGKTPAYSSSQKPKSTEVVNKGGRSKSAAKPKTAGKGDKKPVTPKSAATKKSSSRVDSVRRAPARQATRKPSVAASDDSSDEEEREASPRRRQQDRRVLSSSSSSGGGGGASTEGRHRTRIVADHWAEVYVEEEQRWLSVDVVGGGVHCITEIRNKATQPLMYVVGCDNCGHLKDLTPRYDPKWLSSTRRLRVEPEWWAAAVGAWRPARCRRDKEEDEELERDLQERPMPQSIGEFKDHPLYALERHLLKFQAIYPPSAVPLGFIGKGDKKEPVYARQCVHMLHSRETWIKQARVVKPDETPYKIVKARPKWDRMLQKVITDKPLEVFGRWQTTEYVPPVAENGLVPRNQYGNVELFKPTMLPGGTVHLPVDGLSRVAKKLGIDCAPAMVGWDFHCGGSHPVFEGYVVCQEFEETLMDAWREEQREARRRQREKREKRVLDNWRRLIRGLRIRQRLAVKYSFTGEQPPKRPCPAPTATAKKAKTADTAAKRQPKQKAVAVVANKAAVKEEPGEGADLESTMKSKLDGILEPKAEPKLAAKLSAKLPLVSPKTEEEKPSKEEAQRRVEASMAGMTFSRLALSSDSEAGDSDGGDADFSGFSAPAAATSVAPVTSTAPATEPQTSASRKAPRRRPAAPASTTAKKRRRGAARPASPSSDVEDETLDELASPALVRSSRRGSRPAVSYKEADESEGEAPLRDDDLSSDEEQPFVKEARKIESDDDDDFVEV